MATEWMGLDEAYRKTSIIFGLKFIVKERLWFHWEKFSDVSLNVATVVSRSKKKVNKWPKITPEHYDEHYDEHYGEHYDEHYGEHYGEQLGARRPGRGRGAHSL